MEISKPPTDDEATLRVSLFAELTGGYVRVGEDYNSKDKEKTSFIFIDSTVEKDCPFLMNAGNYDGGNKFTKVCLQPATDSDKEIVIPDASGVIITNGSEADVRSLPGLRKKEGESIFMYIGNSKDKLHIVPPDVPRVNCSQFSCSAPGGDISNCRALKFDDGVFDMYRIFYNLVPDFSKTTWSFEVREILEELKAHPDSTFTELARAFVTRQMEETGMDLGAFDVEAQLMQLYGFGPVLTAERCFVCCCNSYVEHNKQTQSNVANLTNADKGVCPHIRERPSFCLSGPKIGQQCIDADDCVGQTLAGTQRGECGYHEEIVTCLESDRGWLCWNVVERDNLAIRIDFAEPTGLRNLHIPAVSGDFVTTGNLQQVTSLGVQVAPIVALSSHNTSTSIRFERGHPTLVQANQNVLNNTLIIPNNLEQAMLLTTGNLEDITLDSSAMTGLTVENDVYIRRLLKFGDNSSNSGILLQPVFASDQYTKPHSGRPSSSARPGHLSFQVHDSQTVLEFEPTEAGSKLSEITVPSCSGTIVTTGNLEIVTAQSGSMHSLAIDWLSHLQGGVVVGSKLQTQLTLQGHAGHAMTFETFHSKAQSRSQYSTTEVKFELAGSNPSNLIFPAASGTIVSTGNMPDVHEYTGSSTLVHREAHLRGPMFVGSAQASAPEYIDPLYLSGYITGELVHREAKKLHELTRPRGDFTAPFTWDVERLASCKLTGGFLLSGFLSYGQPVARPLFEHPRYIVDPWSVWIMSAPMDQCKMECESKPGCGVLLSSRYWRVKMLSLADYSPVTLPDDSLTNYVSNAIRRIKGAGGFLSADVCYPGFNPIFSGAAEELQDIIPMSGKFDIVMNLTKYPEIETYWSTDMACQGVIAARGQEWESQFGDAWQGFSQLDVQPVKCGTVPCEHIETCPVSTEECTMMIKSRVNGNYLTAFQGAQCDDQILGTKPCAKWTNQTTFWTSIPFQMTSGHSRYDDWSSLGTHTFFRFRRKGACIDVDAAISLPNLRDDTAFTVTCDGDKVQNVTIWWGDVGGTCGGYFNETEQASCTDEIEWIKTTIVHPKCLGDGCTMRLSHEQGGIRLSVTSASGGGTVSRLATHCKGKRFAAEFVCKDQLYLGKAKRGPKPHFELWPHARDDNTLFHLHSTTDLPSVSLSNSMHTHKRELFRECWLGKVPAHDCELQRDSVLDVHMFMRHDSLSLAFVTPSQEREQTFPDSSGVVISSGNLKDIGNLRGLHWKDTFMYRHMPSEKLRDSDYARAPVTHVDFASIGSGTRQRSDGTLPPQFSTPEGGNRRIVFPDSSGTVITTGNIDDLLFKRLNLQGLQLDGDLTFKNINGPLVNIRLTDSSRIAGCLNMVKERGEHAKEHYTQFCYAQITKSNTILLPDVSGRMLTTGNLLNLPTMRFEGSQLFVGQDVILEGELELGREGIVSEIKAFAWVDGDVGMTFSSPNNSLSIEGDVVRLHSPHMGGVDIALRLYLKDFVEGLDVSVRDSKLIGESSEKIAEHPIPGTLKINQTMCFDLLTQHHVHGMHGLGYFVHRRSLIQQTLVSGTPYWGVDMPGNQTFPACVHTPTETIVCEGGNCTCQGLGETMMVRWRRIGKQIINGFRLRCPGLVNDTEKDVATPVWDCQYAEALCNSSILNDAGCAFDGNVETKYKSTKLSLFVATPFVPVQPAVMRLEQFGSNQFPDGMPEIGRCILGLRFSASIGVSMVRVYPASPNSMIGGLLQGSLDPEGKAWVDLYEFKYQPPAGIWTDVLLAQFRDSRFLFVRYLGPGCDSCTCDSAEWEWHQGFISQRLSARDRGVRSYYVKNEALRKDPEGAMVLKCISQGWVPVKLQPDVQEILIPEATGTLLTTGNLEDVTKLSGSMSSVKVSGDVHIQGSTVLGARGEDTESTWNSLLTGRFPLAMGGSGNGNYDANSFFSMPDPTVDNLVYWPPGSVGGRVLTTGNLPSLRDHISIVGHADVRGPVEMNHDVVIGDMLRSSTLMLHSSISRAFPLTFKEASTPDEQKLVFGMEEPSGDRVLMLPDTTGTVITTGNMPDVMEGVTLIGDTVFEGVVQFVNEDVIFGAPESKINLAIHSAIGGKVPLKFEGRQVDNFTLSLAVEEPSGQKVISMPDVTGTVITTGNFPDTVDNLKVLGNVDFLGSVIMLGRKISIGHDELKTKLAVHSVVSGRYPLTFGHVSDANLINETLAATTTFEIIPPTGENVISFPDTSGLLLDACLESRVSVSASTFTFLSISISVSVPVSVSMSEFVPLSDSKSL